MTSCSMSFSVSFDNMVFELHLCCWCGHNLFLFTSVKFSSIWIYHNSLFNLWVPSRLETVIGKDFKNIFARSFVDLCISFPWVPFSECKCWIPRFGFSKHCPFLFPLQQLGVQVPVAANSGNTWCCHTLLVDLEVVLWLKCRFPWWVMMLSNFSYVFH